MATLAGVMWIEVLIADGLKPTTIRVNIMNLRNFFRFLQDMPSGEIKLSMLDFQRLNSQTQRCLKTIHKDVTTHRQKIRRELSRNILPRKMSSQFREKVEEVLPKKLGLLEENPRRQNLKAIYGLLSGYFISMSGHRTGVLSNMLVSEVEDSEVENGMTIIEASVTLLCKKTVFTTCLIAKMFCLFVTGGKPQIGSDLWARPTVPF
ncbi:uncharacterized protein LOC125790256 [Astyanax mexicanus]|uniref:uncharacterized protein LOC125790256 n=1 Tax=Astyanax mexicanus TaxID=7994 RepID=UPI0020CACC76|nr:uncharacterized protein LOC125790256 [Astyanax mexicanus]